MVDLSKAKAIFDGASSANSCSLTGHGSMLGWLQQPQVGLSVAPTLSGPTPT